MLSDKARLEALNVKVIEPGTKEFIDNFIRKEEGKRLYVVHLQASYLAYCKCWRLIPIDLLSLCKKIISHYENTELDVMPFDPYGHRYFNDLELSLPDQNTETFYNLCFEQEKEVNDFRKELNL